MTDHAYYGADPARSTYVRQWGALCKSPRSDRPTLDARVSPELGRGGGGVPSHHQKSLVSAKPNVVLTRPARHPSGRRQARLPTVGAKSPLTGQRFGTCRAANDAVAYNRLSCCLDLGGVMLWSPRSLERKVDIFDLVVVRKDIVQMVSCVRPACDKVSQSIPQIPLGKPTYRFVMYISTISGSTSSETVFSISTPSTRGPSAKLT